MLGFYNNFPKVVHKFVNFATSVSNRRLQSILVETFYKLNNETLALEDVGTPSIPACTVALEIGVAEDNDFNYLDKEEKERLLELIEKKSFPIMDFLCIVRFHKTRIEKKTSLKSDYYMLRFRFGRELTQIRVFHEKGLMYVSPKDLPGFIARRINAEFSKRILKLPERH